MLYPKSAKIKSKVRCFVAIDLPPGLKENLQHFTNHLQTLEESRKVKWVRPNGLHLTLKFLGDVPIEKLTHINNSVTEAVGSLNLLPFKLSIKGIGSFGDAGAPRVIWAGIKGDLPALTKLQQTLEICLSALSIPPDTRLFKPHLTLGRVGEINRDEWTNLDRMVKELDSSGDVFFESFTTSEIVIMESDRRIDGAVYSPIFHLPF